MSASVIPTAPCYDVETGLWSDYPVFGEGSAFFPAPPPETDTGKTLLTIPLETSDLEAPSAPPSPETVVGAPSSSVSRYAESGRSLLPVVSVPRAVSVTALPWETVLLVGVGVLVVGSLFLGQ